MPLSKRLTLVFFLFLSSLSLFAQEKEERDSLVILLHSQSAQMLEIDGARYRKVIGPARFFHNNTYLLCDTAFWNVDSKFIEAIGNVSILQDQTVLTSEKLIYLIDEDLAQFRGGLVQLEDKDHNTLRTENLDYNTKDSVAVFFSGGSMRDKDGQIIESLRGTYDSKIELFTFEENVNMFTDSIFVLTTRLEYNSPTSTATFERYTNAWNDENMLSADGGWYDKENELFLFVKDVHVMSEDQEGWCDSLYYYRNTQDVDMLGRAQVTDTTRNVFALAGSIQYRDSLSQVTLTRSPAVISIVEEDDKSGADSEPVATKDTVYFGADKIVYWTLQKGDIDSLTLAQASERLKNLDTDPVRTFRRKAAEEAAKAAEEAAMDDPNVRAKREAEQAAKRRAGELADLEGAEDSNIALEAPVAPETPNSTDVPDANKMSEPPKPLNITSVPDTTKIAPELPTAPEVSDISDTTDMVLLSPDDFSIPQKSPILDSLQTRDSLRIRDEIPVRDSLALGDSLHLGDSLYIRDSLALADSIQVPKDTTKIGFLKAGRNVKLYRKTAQVVCDSLLYSDLDSLVRLFIEPVIWQDEKNQYSADSVLIVVKNNAMEKANLMSNAFIAIQEDSLHYNQIKSAEMLAFFDEAGELYRFDGLGGSQALFFIEENEVLATVNKKDCKMLSAKFKNGELQNAYYFEAPKSDAYPLAQLSHDDRYLRGFNWQGERRPVDKNSVTELSLRPSERSSYTARPRAKFTYTDKYFPGYMDGVYKQIRQSDSLKVVREQERRRQEELKAELDSLALRDSLLRPDSLAIADSLFNADSLMLPDSLLRETQLDSLQKKIGKFAKDSLSVADSIAPVLDAKAIKAQEKAVAKAAREAERRQKQEEREAKWKLKDEQDEAKRLARLEKRKEKERAKKRKALKEIAEQAEKDEKVLRKYQERFERKKARKERKKLNTEVITE